MNENRQPAYSQALAELEQIISEIESEDVDVDALAAKVKRAAELVKLCRARLRNAEEEVRKVMAEIKDDASEGSVPDEENGPETE